MAKYINKFTRDIITAHLFNGDIEALKKAMPVVNVSEFKFITAHQKGRYFRYFINKSYNPYKIEYRTLEKHLFELDYEPYEEHQDSNAVQTLKWLEQGKIICNGIWGCFLKDGAFKVFEKDNPQSPYSHDLIAEKIFNGKWQIYEEPLQVKVTKLPHEFVEGEKVLMRYTIGNLWKEVFFKYFNPNEDYPFASATEFWNYCIPLEGNEHLKNKVTDCESGAIPKGYSAHKPKLGDDDYWQLGDDVVDLAGNHRDFIIEVNEKSIHLNLLSDYTIHGCLPNINGEQSMRILYHVGSTVNPDGTVNEFVPWRVKYEC